MPVKWIIDAPDGSINGCNNRINIQEYGITNYSFKSGENIIEFTPDKTGRFQYSCWMGMIHGGITVLEAGVDTVQTAENQDDLNQLPIECCGVSGAGVAKNGGSVVGSAGGDCCTQL
jgi:hypothetical protein